MDFTAESLQALGTGFWVKVLIIGGVGLILIYILTMVFVTWIQRGGYTAKKKEIIKEKEVEPAAEAPKGIQGRLEQILFKANDNREAVAHVAEMIYEEAAQMSEMLRKEFNDKYQRTLTEKNSEIDTVKKVYTEVRSQYEEAEKTIKRVNIERRQTEAVVKSIADGLVVVNEKGEVLLMNPSAEKLLGVSSGQKVGQPLVDGLGDEHMVALGRSAGGENSGERIVEYHSGSENTKKILRSSGAVIQNEDGQTIGMVNILTDVTKQRELEDMKQRFISNVTHELRTPLVAMQNAVVILNKESESMTDTQKKFLDIVSRNAAQLKSLVQDVLDVAKIDSGKMKIHPKMHKIQEVIKNACDLMDTWAKNKEIEIVRQIDESAPETALDSDKITQVMNNFLSNAIKFTPPKGKITVTLVTETDKQQLRVSVADNGCGVQPEHLPKLFQRFEQFGDQQGIMGTGLGLAIVKDSIEKHGGLVAAESELKKGSVFSFTLPIKQLPAQETISEEKAHDG